MPTRRVRGKGGYRQTDNRRGEGYRRASQWDIAKGVSKAQIFLDRGRPHGRGFDIVHTADGLTALQDRLREVETLTGVRPVPIFESTGHYHRTLSGYFEDQGDAYVLLNPLIAHDKPPEGQDGCAGRLSSG